MGGSTHRNTDMALEALIAESCCALGGSTRFRIRESLPTTRRVARASRNTPLVESSRRSRPRRPCDHPSLRSPHQREEKQQSELAAIQHKLTDTHAAMDRYFHAFEARTCRRHLRPTHCATGCSSRGLGGGFGLSNSTARVPQRAGLLPGVPVRHAQRARQSRLA